MMQFFVERNLNNTINFLCKVGLAKECSLSFDNADLNAISSQNIKNFHNSYKTLLCKSSILHFNCVVFCNCCSSRKIFLRNYSLVQQFLKIEQNSKKILIIKCPDYKNDPFLNFIEALIEKDKNIAIESIISIILEIPLFWDAYLILCELTDKFISFDTPLAPFFYLQLKILKDIDPPIINLSFLKSNSFNIQSLPYNTDILDLNSKAALNYCYGNQKLALEIFKSIDFSNNFDISYFELFGMLIYNTNDLSLKTLCENLNNFFKFLPETYVIVGLFRLSNANYSEASILFKKSLKKKKNPDVFCLLAYSYIKLNDFSSAMGEYEKALNLSPNNFRIFYSVAQGYFSMNKLEVSLWYCKKALDIRGDGSIYKLMGRIYVTLNNLEVALKYFETSILHEEVDSLLYIADAYRKKNEMKIALKFYERYVLEGRKNVKVVVKYLVDYYEEHANEEKLKYFREIYKNLTAKV